MFSRKTAIVCAAVAALSFSGVVAQASLTISTGFESGDDPGFFLYAGGTGATAALSTEQAYAGTHSVKFNLSGAGGSVDVWREVDPGQLQLGTTSGTFQTYIPSGQTAYMPFMLFGVDSNQNGLYDFGTSAPDGGDSLVIAFFTQAYTPDSWTESGLNSATNVHVVYNRTGLGTTEFSSSHGGGLLSDLYGRTINGTTWGDLDILEMDLQAGEGHADPYVAYIDNINITSTTPPVPEPATMALLGMGGLCLLARRRRRA